MFRWKVEGAVFLAACFLVGWGDPARKETARGVKAYGEKRYDEALASFLRAARETPDRPVLSFNLGAALYQNGRFEDALAAFHAARQAEETAAAALYGAGNTLFQAGKPAEAAELYKQALRRDSDDRDAKHNLELVQRLLDERKNQEDQRQEPQSDEGEPEKPREQEEPEAPQEEEGEEKNPLPANENETSAPEEAETEGEPPSSGEMSRAEAERILAALAEEEENLRRESMQERRSKRKATAKDW